MVVQLKPDAPKNDRLNKEIPYRVVGLEFHSDSSQSNTFRVMVRLMDNGGIPALFDWSNFKVLDHSIESDFVVRKEDSGFTVFAASAINFQGFWESFFNDDEYSRQLFKDRYPEFVDQLF